MRGVVRGKSRFGDDGFVPLMVVSVFVCVAIALMAVVGCGADDPVVDDDDDEPYVYVPKPPPEPHWADGTIDVIIGRHQTGKALYHSLKNAVHAKTIFDPGYYVGPLTEYDLLNTDPPFPMSGRLYAIEVSVVFMTEVGVTEPATIDTVLEKYREAGYRPLTPEEAAELRLQFTDQPDTQHGHFMGEFLVLPDEHTLTTIAHPGAPTIFKLYMYGGGIGESSSVGISQFPLKKGGADYLFHPTKQLLTLFRAEHERQGARFACVKVD